MVGLAERASVESAVLEIGEQFAAMHPELAEQAAVYMVETADGLSPLLPGEGQGEVEK